MQEDNTEPTPPLQEQPSPPSGSRVIQPVTSGFAPPDQSPEPVTAPVSHNPSNIYPSVDTTNQSGPLTHQALTGSRIAPLKTKLPVGIYIIAVLNLIGFVVGFFDTSQNSTIYLALTSLNLFVAIGLLVRLDAARKLLVWLEAIGLVAFLVLGFLLFRAQNNLHQLKRDYDAAITKINQSNVSPDIKKKINTLNETLAVNEKAVGKAITFAYIKLGAASVTTVIIIVYLTRPRVKEVFHKLQS